MPILYSFRRCPYAIRARLALVASGMTCDIREIRLSAKPPEMIAASPKGTVPILILPDGQVIDQSLDIMRWALRTKDPGHWLDHEDEALIATNDGPFKHHLDRYKYPERHGADPLVHRAAGQSLLEVLDARLEMSENLCGAAFGLTDAALLPFVRQFAATDWSWFDALPLPALQSWLGRHLKSALFEAAMVRLAPWQAGDPATLFPAPGES